MAHYVGLELNGDTIDLTTGDNILGQYSIRPARPVDAGMYGPVEERIRVTFAGASASAVQSSQHAVEQLLSYSVERKSAGEGPRLFLEVQPDGYSDRYRVEIYSGIFVPDSDTLELWVNNKVTGHLEISRSPFFEGPRTALTLTNRNGTSSTWLQVDNKNDSTNDAFVDVDKTATGDNLDGSLPAPVELHVRNDEAGGQFWNAFYIGVNSRSDPFALEPILEFEDQSGGGGSTVTFADSSSGEYWSSGSVSSGSHLYPRITIPAAITDAFAGRFARVLLKTMSSTWSWVYQIKIKEQYGLITIFAGRPRVGAPDTIVDLGVVPIPPVAYTTDLAEQKIEVEMYQEGGTDTLGLDYIILMPTDSGRTIYQTGMQIPAGDYVIFDEIERVWVSNESDLKHPIFTPRGPGVFIVPQVANRIWILHNGGDAYGTKSVRAYYRPRRLTL